MPTQRETEQSLAEAPTVREDRGIRTQELSLGADTIAEGIRCTRCDVNQHSMVVSELVLILLSAFLLTVPCHAQCRESDFPGAGGIAAAPSRPVESSSPDPIQAGVTEVEMGITHSWLPNQESQNALMNLVKFGAWCNVELRWSANSFLSSTVGAKTTSGFGDNYMTAQYRFHRETSWLPAMAIGYTVKFPSADATSGLGSGYTDSMVMLMFGKTVKKVSWVINANYFEIGKGNGQHASKLELTLGGSRSLKGHWGVIGEIYYDSHLNEFNAAYGNSTWALTYTVNRRLVLDGGAYVGLSHGPGVPDTSIFVGVSYALGRLYEKPHLGLGAPQ